MTLFPDGSSVTYTSGGTYSNGSCYVCQRCGVRVSYYSNLPHQCYNGSLPNPTVQPQRVVHTLDPQIVILLGRLVAAVERLVA